MAVTTNKNVVSKPQGNTQVRVQDSTSKVAGMIFSGTVKQPIPTGSKGKMGDCSLCGE